MKQLRIINAYTLFISSQRINDAYFIGRLTVGLSADTVNGVEDNFGAMRTSGFE